MHIIIHLYDAQCIPYEVYLTISIIYIVHYDINNKMLVGNLIGKNLIKIYT